MRTQYDKFPTGGSDSWDNDTAGAILTAEFFGVPAAPAGGMMKHWDGAAWVAKPLKYWDGSAFVQGMLKHWDGVDWQLATP